MALRQEADRHLYLVTNRIDPEGLDGFVTQYQINSLFAQFSESSRAAEFYDRAVQAMAEIVKRDPTNLHFRYQYIEVLMRHGKTGEARAQIQKSLELDRVATESGRKLTEEQRAQIERWLTSLRHD
jgi:hypothetical protein